MHQRILFIGLLILALGLILGACAAPEALECPDCSETDCPVTECPECPQVDYPEGQDCPVVECPTCPEAESVLPGIEAAWSGSGHADSESAAFRNWDEDDPPVIGPECSKCHSSAGYMDFHGADGSEPGEINNAEVSAHENLGIECEACHNQQVAAKTSLVMPSGIELTDLGAEARCMECHQGRHSLTSLNASIAEAAGVDDAAEADPDTVYEDLGFSNIHYYPAAATKYGTLAKGGGEYAGKSYDGNFAHVDEFDTCIECHSSHTLEVRGESCAQCHEEDEYQDYRMLGSAVDYDGDGDIEEGVYHEITTLAEILLAEIQAYPSAHPDLVDIAYLGHYPYWGAANEGEELLWTPRLARAAYNYQLAVKDPGGFAHGGKYIIQLLYDSIEDLGGEVSTLNRDDHGHFQGSSDAFRHWDPGTRDDGVVPADCARCHSADGLPLFFAEGVNISTTPANGFQCETCHGGGEWPARYAFTSVTFPSGAVVIPAEGDESVLCMQCHQGRSSGPSVDRAIDDLGDNDVMEDQNFLNVHYFAAGATRYGSVAVGGYQYADKEYAGIFEHAPGFKACTECHDAHEPEVQTDQCFTCHADVEDVHDIRMTNIDYDGDGDVTEGVYDEIVTLKEVLYEAIVAYSISNETTNEVAYLGHYPYWAAAIEGEDLIWTPDLLRAAYNFQFAEKDPGGFTHNNQYIIQLLYDSIQAVGGDVGAYTRP
ncbi:hypothetical protein ACFLXI_04160 [Chloroflexota bacterium]